ncbi:MAG: histidine kinase [Bacteroidetes bacterium]|nr:histidine kinase [Bacteroidota bacterium]
MKRKSDFDAEEHDFNWFTRNYLLLILGVGLFISLIYLISNEYADASSAIVGIGSGILNTAAIWIGCVFIVSYLWKKYPWQEKPVRHLVLEVILITLHTLIVSGIIFFTQKDLFATQDGQTFIMAIFTTLLITYLITAIHESVFFYRQWKFHFGRSTRLERDNISARYEALRTQVNPHFLFNSLNSLSSLVENNPKAVEYIGHMSDLLRYMLSSSEKEFSLLRDELKVLNSYLALQKLRFGQNLLVDVRIPESAFHLALPPLSLQMLAENAIKHNVITADKPLYISVFIDEGRLVVQNNLQPRQGVASTGKGLNNISGRYALYTTKEVVVEKDSGIFRVSLPLLEVEL